MSKDQVTEVGTPMLLSGFPSLGSIDCGIKNKSLRKSIGENPLTKTEGKLGKAREHMT